MADRYLLESGSPDGYLLEDGSGVLLLDAPGPVAPSRQFVGSNGALIHETGTRQVNFLGVQVSETSASGTGTGLIKVWTGAAWVEKPLKVWTGSAWTLA